MSFKEALQRNLMLLPGWRTRRRIVVIESDDWGAIRTPDRKTLWALNKINWLVEKDLMTQLDALESNEDLLFLFEVLRSVKDKNNRPAILTANTIVANPDFERIAASVFQTYYYEKVTDTLQKYSGREQVFNLIEQGITEKLYQPQLHGREHLNVQQWLSALQNGNAELLEAFRYNTFGIPLSGKISKRNNLMSAFDFEDENETPGLEKIIEEGTDLFRDIFGFTSTSFIATTYVWHSSLEPALYTHGIKYLQGIPYQYIPSPGNDWYRKKFHFTGQKNNSGQLYLVRNASFEPYMQKNTDVVGECLHRINMAFRWGKPAIIGSHRVNFIGSLDESNRTRNLKLLNQLLTEIVKSWPDVEFMSSDELGELILQSKK